MDEHQMAQLLGQMQQQLQQLNSDNQALRQRIFEQEQRFTNGPGGEAQEVLQALRALPEALGKLSQRAPKSLIDTKGLGKPQTLGEDAESKFRVWSVKLEDYITGLFGHRAREVLEWAASSDVEVTKPEVDQAYGNAADAIDQWEEVYEFDQQLYSVLRATTESIPFDLVENCPSGCGLEAWRCLHKKYDPSTGGRKRVMLNALTNPERASYETLGGALERWKSLRPEEGPAGKSREAPRQPCDECA